MTLSGVKPLKSLSVFLKSGFVLLTVALSFVFAAEIKEGVLSGMRIGALEVIPAIFPSLVLSDYIYSAGLFDFKTARILFAKLFNLPENFCRPFILSSLFGFPVGAKCCAEEYANNKSIKQSCESAVCLCSNPSLAFCAFAVGLGIFDKISVGIILYFSMLISTVIAGMLLRPKEKEIVFPVYISGQSFDFSSSVKSAGLASLTVCSFISFFSAAIALIEQLGKSQYISAISACFFEVGNAAAKIHALNLSSIPILSFLGFALGYSGLSVILQARASLPNEIRLFKLHFFKLLEGIICAVLAPAFYYILILF